MDQISKLKSSWRNESHTKNVRGRVINPSGFLFELLERMQPVIRRPFLFASKETTAPQEKTKIRPKSSGIRILVAVADPTPYIERWTEYFSDVVVPEAVKGILGARQIW